MSSVREVSFSTFSICLPCRFEPKLSEAIQRKSEPQQAVQWYQQDELGSESDMAHGRTRKRTWRPVLLPLSLRSDTGVDDGQPT